MRKQKKIDQIAPGSSHEEEVEAWPTHDEQLGYLNTLACAIKPSSKIEITPEIVARFQKGLKQFDELRPGTSVTEAYQHTRQYYFQVSYKLQHGILVPLLFPAEQFTAFRQFQYWYKQQVVSTPTRLAPEKDLSLNSRARITNSVQSIPGHTLFPIDAVMSDTQALSLSGSGRIIERPIIYLVLDAFNQMIVGIRVSWKQPNERRDLLALENASMEEVQFCQAFEVVEWSVPYRKQALLGPDPSKTEEGSADPPDYPVVSLDIPNLNASPSCRNWNPIIERTFRLYNTIIARNLHLSLTNASAEKQARRQRKPDYRLSSALTLERFWAIFTSRRRSTEPSLPDGLEITQ